MIISSHRTFLSEQLPPLPIALKAIGYYYAERNWSELNDGKTRSHCGVFWCASGGADIMINQKKYHLNTGDFLFYYPYDAHHIIVNESHFEYYWMTFDGLLAAEILQAYHFTSQCNYGGPVPKEIWLDANKTLSEGTMNSLYIGSTLVYRLLTYMKNGNKTKDVIKEPLLVKQFKDLVEDEIGDKELDLNKIAKKLKCHRTTLTRLIRKHIGFLPGQYLKHVRLKYAMELLQNSNYTAAEISDLCGFSTPEFFSRCFRKMTGEPPKRFRNHF